MKTVLVTGAGGYLGNQIVDELLKSKFKVKAVDNFFFKNRSIFKNNKNLQVIKSDTRNLPEKFFKNVFAVIDLVNIGISPIGDRFFDKLSWDINYHSRVRTCRIAKRNNVKRYIFPSSCSVYGFRKDYKLVNENTAPSPKSTYAKTKVKLEKTTIKLSDKKFKVLSLRLPTLFGFSKKMRNDLIVNFFAGHILKNKSINLMGDGKQARPFLHVNDAAKAFVYFTKLNDDQYMKNNIVCVGDNQNNITLIDLAKKIFKIYKIKKKIKFYGKKDNRSYFCDFSLLGRLGFKCSRNIEFGLKELQKKKLFLKNFSNIETYPIKLLNEYKNIELKYNELMKEKILLNSK